MVTHDQPELQHAVKQTQFYPIMMAMRMQTASTLEQVFL